MTGRVQRNEAGEMTYPGKHDGKQPGPGQQPAEPAGSDGFQRDVGSIPGLERSLGGMHDNPLQYSCLENPMDRGAWQATVHRVTKCWTQLK